MDRPFVAYSGEESYVFVCYAHEDEDVVYPEIALLNEQGVHLWYDEGISAGRIWRAEIAEAIEAASKILLYVSESSLESHHCGREINLALDLDKDILPVYLEDVELTADLRIGLSQVHALYRRDADYQQHLFAALGRSSASSHEAHTRRPPWPAFAVVLVVAGLALAFWWYLRVGESEPVVAADSTQMIAVRELRNLTPDEELAWLAEGLTEQLRRQIAVWDQFELTSKCSAAAVDAPTT